MLNFILFRVFTKFRLSYQKWSKINATKQVKNNLRRLGKHAEGFSVGHDVVFSGLSELSLGRNISIGSGSFIRCDGGLDIGSNVVISRNVTIYSCSHEYEGCALPFDDNFRNRKVSIGDNVWIGMNVNIAPGTVIHEGAIIGMGVTVHGEIPACSIVVNSGAKIIKYRNENHYNRLKEKRS